MLMKNYINPECMPYYYDAGGEKILKRRTQSIAYTADGFLLPCCWCDAESTKKDIVKLNMYAEQLKLSNNDTVEHILHSDIWENFINIIMNTYDKAPRCCKEKCGVKNE